MALDIEGAYKKLVIRAQSHRTQILTLKLDNQFSLKAN